MKQKIETITPDLAQKYLAFNSSNRPIRQRWVDTLAVMIRKGEWKLTHQGIAFDMNGRLVDGQHRLYAIVKAGVPVPMNVAHGLEDGSYRFIDGGLLRSWDDRIKLVNAISENKYIVRIVRAYARHALHDRLVNINVIEDLFLEHTEAFYVVGARFAREQSRSITQAPVGAAIASYAMKHGPKSAAFLDEFMRAYDHAKGSPALILRETLLRGTVRDAEAYWKTIAATRFYQRGETCEKIQAVIQDWQGNESGAAEDMRDKMSRATAVRMEKQIAEHGNFNSMTAKARAARGKKKVDGGAQAQANAGSGRGDAPRARAVHDRVAAKPATAVN